MNIPFQQTTQTLTKFDPTALIGGAIGCVGIYCLAKKIGGPKMHKGLLIGAAAGGLVLGAGVALKMTKKQDKFYSVDGDFANMNPSAAAASAGASVVFERMKKKFSHIFGL